MLNQVSLLYSLNTMHDNHGKDIMRDNLGLLATNVALLRTRASRRAYQGMAVALAAVLVATVITEYMSSGGVSPAGMFHAQRTNPALWLLDLMPFAFAFWGQYFSVVVAHEAGALVMDQTEALRASNRALEARAQRRSHMDNLTGLPNRELFLDRAGQAIQRAHMESHSVGALVLNIDSFTEINQTLGQHSGDRVLQSVAKRLRSANQEPATVARLGADNFAVLLPNIDGKQGLVEGARRISRALEPNIALENIAIAVRVNVGASLCPEHAIDAESLLNAADSAMHEAKTSAANFMLYQSGNRKQADPGMLSLVAELRHAIDLDQLDLYVQPIVNPAQRESTAVEVLLRWTHPRLGAVPPSEFIPRAERSGLINDLTEWVLRRALELSKNMAREGVKLHMSVNISARTLLDADFPDMLAGLLAASEVPGERLTLEITEDTLMSDHQSIGRAIDKLAALGLQFSIDDFGTGYSQLAYLKRLPVSEIKIDRSFVKDMLKSSVDASIVEATINLGHALDLRVVAEGVEELAEAERLVELKCDLLQGYYFAKPMPDRDFPRWLQQWQAAPNKVPERRPLEQPG